LEGIGLASPVPLRQHRHTMIRHALVTLAMCTVTALHAADDPVVLTLEPSPQFPRNSEGSFVTLKSGRVLFLYTQLNGTASRKDCEAVFAFCGG
jgi:hypothetical protein